MDAKELFKRCLNFASEVNAKVTAKEFNKPTPCAEWTVRDLAAHVLYELAWVPDMVAGKTVAEVGTKYDGDLMGDDFVAAWAKAAAAAERAVDACDLKAAAHLSYKDTTNDYFLREQASDFLIHGWDMVAALALNTKLDPTVAQAVYDDAKPKFAEMGANSMFASPIKVSDNADIQTKLLALLGRDANWKP